MRSSFKRPPLKRAGAAPLPALLSALLLALGGCAEAQSLGASLIEQRRVANDLQARATMAAVCDIALGAYFRELNEAERRYASLVCGGLIVVDPGGEDQEALAARPAAGEALAPLGAAVFEDLPLALAP